jgi:uncharacterized protein (DUF2147 family)
MRGLTKGALALLLLGTLGAGSAMASPPEGIYQTEPGDTGGFLHVRMGPCGKSVAKACGTILQAYDKTGKPVADYPHANKPIVWDMAERSDGSFSGGKIWAPDRNKTYRSKMSVNGDRLKVSGCIGPICRSQTWVKVK